MFIVTKYVDMHEFMDDGSLVCFKLGDVSIRLLLTISSLLKVCQFGRVKK